MRKACYLLKQLAAIPPSKAHLLQSSKVLESRNYSELGISEIDDGQWCSLCAYLNRNWFRRAWIFQEVALAKRPVMICGGIIAPWALLVLPAIILQKSRMWDSIKSTAEAFIQGASGFWNSLSPLRSQPLLYQIPHDNFIDPNRTIIGIEDVRAGLEIKDQIMVYSSGTGKAYDFGPLCHFFVCRKVLLLGMKSRRF